MGESMAGLVRSHMCGEVNEAFIGESVTVMGWVQRRRDMSGRYFIILRDRTDIVQVVVDAAVNEEIFKKAKEVKSEYVLAVKGKVIARTQENINPAMKTGKIEIECEELKILSESQTPPFHIEEGSQAGLDLRLKYRYLDLRRPDLYQNMYLRHKAAQLIRRYYSDHGFLEIETPMLTKSTPEGARDYLVPSRVHPGNFYALPQSPQVLKQLLMVSGMDKYFQIVKCFRDEDLRADRQPEFTQIDLEMSFVNEKDVMEINEGLIKILFKELKGLDVTTPFKRMTYKEAMERFGSDKPDVRFGMELKDISQTVQGCEFVVFANALSAGGSVRGINAKGCAAMGRKQIDKLVDFVKDFGAKGLAWIHIQESGDIKSQISKFFTDEKMNEIIKALDGQPGDLLLICADQDKVVFDALGNLRLEVAKKQNMIPENTYEFLWVTEFPLLEWDEEDKRYVALHHPFTAPMEEDFELLQTAPESVRARAYDMVLNGVELGGGSIRIHQQDVQSKMFELLGFTEESAQAAFGYLLEAFQYGVPPHGGLAFGLDRIMMLMTGSDSIRDVIAFPKVKDASCPMTKAPTTVTEEQLEELGIAVIPQNEPAQE